VEFAREVVALGLLHCYQLAGESLQTLSPSLYLLEQPGIFNGNCRLSGEELQELQSGRLECSPGVLPVRSQDPDRPALDD
jgi:hypothetical protein